MNQKLNLVISSLALCGVMYLLICNSQSLKKVVYIDTNKVVESYKDMKTITAAYQAKLNEYQSRIDQLTNEFNERLQKYQAERKLMSLEEQLNQERFLSDKQKKINEYKNQLQKQVKIQDNEAVQKMVADINSLILEYGKNHNYKIILAANGTNLAYADEGLDITEDMIKALNN